MKILTNLIFIPGVFFLAPVLLEAAFLPPDFDFDHKYVYEAPEGLEAGWHGDDVYISWHKARDRFGRFVTGYRLYRAANRDSVFVQLETEEDHNLIPSANYFDTAEALEEAGIIHSERFFYKVTALVVRIEGPSESTYLYESSFSEPFGLRRGAEFRCFVTASAYRTPMAKETVILSSFRDRFLLASPGGGKLIRIYEKLSPRYAAVISGSSALRLLTRMHLAPIVRAANWTLNRQAVN